MRPALLLLSGFLLASPARADEARARLSLEDPAGCIQPLALRAEVERRLGRAVFSGRGPQVELRVRVKAGASWRATLALSRADASPVGAREIDAPTCAALAEGLSLVAALMLDVLEPAPPEPAPAPAPGAPLEAMAELRALLGPGPLRGLAAGGLAALGLARGPARVGLEASLWPPREGPIGGYRASVGGWSAGAWGCALAAPAERVAVGPCLRLGVEQVTAQGTGFSRDLRASLQRVEVGAEARVEVRPAGPLWLVAQGGPAFSPTPFRLVAQGEQGATRPLHEGDRLRWRAGAGLLVRF